MHYLFQDGKHIKNISHLRQRPLTKKVIIMDGYYNVKPEIKKILFEVRGKMEVVLKDGRSVIVPLSAFPTIKKIPVSKRKDYYLLGNDVFSWRCTNEVFHIEQILGCFDFYSHEAE